MTFLIGESISYCILRHKKSWHFLNLREATDSNDTEAGKPVKSLCLVVINNQAGVKSQTMSRQKGIVSAVKIDLLKN